MGKAIAQQSCNLVYGGGNVGLMGLVADAVLEGGGQVVGVIPEFLSAKEVAHDRITELYVVNSMHERKALMAELSDAFITLPGGFGTLEEFCEILSWAQLGLHQKPQGLLNIEGYYTPLLELFDRTVAEGFVQPTFRHLVVSAVDPESLLSKLQAYQPPVVEKLIQRQDET
jgi:uncharacterized protein (TIGR00730 family)